jgi:hypothetical protein
MLKKILLRTLLSLFVLVLGIFLIFLIANWRDQDLRPEVQSALNWQVPKVLDEDNAFLVVLGLNAKEGIDPVSLGKRKLTAELLRYEKNRYLTNDFSESANDPDEVVFVKPKSEVCDYVETANCVVFYLSRSAEQEQEILKSQRVLLSNFDRLKLSKTYQEIAPPHIAASIPSYGSVMHAAELDRMRAVRLIANGQVAQGLDLLLQVSAFSQRWLENSNSAISHMVALASVQRDLRVCDELLQRFPKLRVDVDKMRGWISQFSATRMNIAKAFAFERQVSMHIMQSTLALPEDVQKSELQQRLVKLINRPNAAMNLTYDWHGIRLDLLQKSSQEYIATRADIEKKQKELLGIGTDYIYLRDPFTKIVLSVSTPSYDDYVEKHYDTFAQINLLALKLDLLKQHIPPNDIPAFVQAHATQYPNPYDGKALGWDAEKQQLFVELRQASNQIYQKSKVIRLNILPSSASGAH